jgi:hypothetical protein
MGRKVSRDLEARQGFWNSFFRGRDSILRRGPGAGSPRGQPAWGARVAAAAATLGSGFSCGLRTVQVNQAEARPRGPRRRSAVGVGSRSPSGLRP